MQIKTFTSFWSIEKKLYSIYDFSLPAPVSLRVLGVFTATAIPWWVVMRLLHVPLSSPWYLIYLLPPVFIAYLGSRPIFEGKTLFQFLGSRIRYLFENKRYKGLTPDLEDREATYVVKQKFFRFRR
jgi:hypothetical protein